MIISVGSVLPVAGDVEYVNQITIVEYNGVADAGNPEISTPLMNVESSGSDYDSGILVPEGGASFFLWTERQETVINDFAFPAEEFLLDIATVTSFLPTAEISVQTHDQYAPRARTRADQPFQVVVNVEGLKSDADLLDNSDFDIDELGEEHVYLQQLSMQRYAALYPADSNNLPDDELDANDLVDGTLYLAGNGEHPASNAYWTPSSNGEFQIATGSNELLFNNSFLPENPDEWTFGNFQQARGEEQFVVYADIPNHDLFLARASVQVWPVWSGTKVSGLEGAEFIPYVGDAVVQDPEFLTMEMIDPQAEYSPGVGETTYEYPPEDISFQFYNLYPNSEVRVIVNDASEPSPWGGRKLSIGKVFNEDGSFDWQLDVGKFEESVFEGNGRYGIWIVVHTPGIGWEVGGQISNTGAVIPGGWTLSLGGPKITVRGSLHGLQE